MAKRQRNKERRAYLKHRKPMANTELMKLYVGNVESKASDYLNRIFYATKEKPAEPRVKVLKKLEEWTNSVDRHRHIVMYGGSLRRLIMFFTSRNFQNKDDGPLEEVFFIENDIRSGIVRRSMLYPSRERAKIALEQKRITWVFIEATERSRPKPVPS